MKSLLRPALSMLVLLSFGTGVVYPLFVTGVVRAAFPERAGGSLITRGDRVVGSELIGQPFSDPAFFWSRPSATARHPYDATLSAGSNLGPTNPALAAALRSRIARLRAADPGNDAPIPADLVTASASGLDPHLSPAAARHQAARVARARGLDAARVLRLIEDRIEPRFLGLFGEPRVNVVLLNLALSEAVR